MSRTLWLRLWMPTLVAMPGAALGQGMAGMAMPNMGMPTPPAKAQMTSRSHVHTVPKPRRKAPVARSRAARSTMPDVDMTGPQAKPMPGMTIGSDGSESGGMPMPGMAMPESAMAGTALPAGHAAPPPVPSDRYAGRQYPPAAMYAADRVMMHQQGGQLFYQIMVNLAEYQARQGHDGYRWDGEAWFGGDIDRAELRTEGTGTLRRGTDDAEMQALYSHAIDPYFNLEAGIRQDFAPTPTRTYATVGIEGLAPFMFQTEARLFVSTRGEVLGRLEAWYDQRVTQRLVLQPRAELNLSAQTTPARRIGSGLYDAELGLRLRYEIARRFAPYVGISYAAETGRTARYARTDGKDPTTTSFVAGARFWF